MNEIKVFEHIEFGQVRTMVVNGEAWFVGKDVADSLGYSNSSKAVMVHVDETDRKKEMLAHSQNGNVVKTQTTLINESGMYALIFGSKLESAQRFKLWVTREVLPSIRKYGGYIAGQEDMSDEQLMSRAYLVALKQINARTEELDKLMPKGEYFDRFISLGNCTCLRDTAKELGIPQNRFISILIENGYLYRNQKGKLRFYSTASEFFELKDYINRFNGAQGVYTVVRPEGKAYFMALFKEMGEI